MQTHYGSYVDDKETYGRAQGFITDYRHLIEMHSDGMFTAIEQEHCDPNVG